MIIEMYKCMLTGLRSDFLDIAEYLRESKSLQLREFEDFSMQTLLEGANFHVFHEMVAIRNKLEALTSTAASVEVNLPTDVDVKTCSDDALPKNNKELIDFFIAKVEEIDSKYDKIKQRNDHLSQKKKAITIYQSHIERIRPLIQELSFLKSDYKSFFLLLETRDNSSLAVTKLIKSKFPESEVFSRVLDDRVSALIIVALNVPEIHEFLLKEKISTTAIPEELADLPIQKVFGEAQHLSDIIANELLDLEKEKEKLSSENLSLLKVLGDVAQKKLIELSLVDEITLTEYTFTVTGFIPKNEMKKFEDGIRKKFGDTVTIFFDPVDFHHDKDVPVVRKYPKLLKGYVQPFEMFTDLLTKPKYGHLDPTFLIAILWPFFWGFMVGDVGYGFLAILLGIGVTKKMSGANVKRLGRAFMYAGVFSIVFGFVYFEFFGDLPLRIINALTGASFHEIETQYVLFDRYNRIIDYLLLSIVVAFVCMLIASGLGIKNRHGKHRTVCIATFIMLLSLIGIVIDATMLHSVILMELSLISILGCVVVFVVLEKIQGIVHTLEVMTAILSYARLMAIGLVGVILANIANMFMFGQAIANPITHEVIFKIILPPIVGIPSGFFLHILNFAIIILSPSIQALRLNLVEMMTEYYEGGGKDFHPFGKTEGATI